MPARAKSRSRKWAKRAALVAVLLSAIVLGARLVHKVVYRMMYPRVELVPATDVCLSYTNGSRAITWAEYTPEATVLCPPWTQLTRREGVVSIGREGDLVWGAYEVSTGTPAAEFEWFVINARSRDAATGLTEAEARSRVGQGTLWKVDEIWSDPERIGGRRK